MLRITEDDVPVLERLFRQPHGFEFFQAVRWLNLWAVSDPALRARRRPIGYDFSPASEIVRFQSWPSHSFPPGEIAALEMPHEDDGPGRPLQMVVTFLGLIGPQGVLPQHYTQTVIDQRREGHAALQEFLDLFHHRLVSLFYRAWEKYHFPVKYERDQRFAEDGSPPASRQVDDAFTQALYALIGLGTPHLRSRMANRAELFLHYGGQYSRQVPAVDALERMLQHQFGWPARIEQFVGQWLWLEPEDQTCLPGGASSQGRNTQLGRSALVGNRVWSVENKFRVTLGPLDYQQFLRLTPQGASFTEVAEFVRLYVGSDYDVEIQPILRRDEVPPARLDGTPLYLGWNSWLWNDPPRADALQAVFLASGVAACA